MKLGTPCTTRGICIMALLVIIGCGGDNEHDSRAQPLRVFAVGNKLELRYADTYANYHDKMFALVDRNYPRRTELVQADVDDVVTHLAGMDSTAPARALVVFPEDVALVAGVIGSRGALARRVRPRTGGSTAAFASLIFSYDPQIDYYTARFPGLPAVRYLLLAETDTFYRAAYETFRAIAQTYRVYVAATWNAAPARRVEFDDDPDLVMLLRDPDEAATRSYAYVAESGDVYNATYIFDPAGNVLVRDAAGNTFLSPDETDGTIRASFNKAYLTEPEQDALPLAYGRVQDLDVLDTPIGRIASVISKDAWMIDVNDRLDAKGAALILQPEAFSEWAFVAAPWQPDSFKSGGVAQLQRNPSFRFNVTASMTGNLYEVTFDGQSAVIGKRGDPESGPGLAFIGQSADPALRAVAPWVVDEPSADLSLQERRGLLAETGARLLPEATPICASPTEVGACENGYRESVIFADIETQPRASGAQRRPRVAARGGHVYVVWEDDRDDFPNVYLRTSSDGGRSFREVRVSDNASGSVVEMRPTVAIDAASGEVSVAWQELCSGWDDDCGRIQLARFHADGSKIDSDIRVDHGGDGAGKWNPAITVSSGEVSVAWIDERDHASNGTPLEHIYFARSRGGSFDTSVRADSGEPVRAAINLDNKWAPSLASIGGRSILAWTDFRNYQWDIFGSVTDAGDHFTASVRIDDATAFERIHDAPALATDESGNVHAVWADHRNADPDTNIFYARSSDGGLSYGANVRVDSSARGFDPDRDTPSNQWHPRLAVSAGEVHVVWQDNRLGDNDIWVTQSTGGGTFDRDEPLASNDGEQTRPDIAIDESDPRGRVRHVVWEDGSDGSTQVVLVSHELN